GEVLSRDPPERLQTPLQASEPRRVNGHGGRSEITHPVDFRRRLRLPRPRPAPRREREAHRAHALHDLAAAQLTPGPSPLHRSVRLARRALAHDGPQYTATAADAVSLT